MDLFILRNLSQNMDSSLVLVLEQDSSGLQTQYELVLVLNVLFTILWVRGFCLDGPIVGVS